MARRWRSSAAALSPERGPWPRAWRWPLRPSITAELYANIARVEVIFARYRQGGAASVEHHTLLPLDTAALAAVPAALAPLHNLEPQAPVEGLAAEYLFALLTEAAVESIASENAARFAAMESAHDNVSHKLADLQQAAHQVRQDEITAELLDLIVGAEALTKHAMPSTAPPAAER